MSRVGRERANVRSLVPTRRRRREARLRARRFFDEIVVVEEVCVLEVVEIGYRLGSVELRPAKVVVAVAAE